MITYTEAVSFLKSQIQSRIPSGQGILKHMYLYGSVSAAGQGYDLDVILEVDLDAFETYCRYCLYVLDGVTPFTNDLLQPRHGQGWDYFSPKSARTRVALETIGIDPAGFKEAVLTEAIGQIRFENLDIVCLPEGWDTPDSDVYQRLERAMSNSRDPLFLLQAAGSCVEITA